MMLLYVSCPAVSHSDSFMCFCSCFCFEGDTGAGACEVLAGLLILRAYEAGGPTGTMRDPNSTPIVTSWCGEKRPSHRRTVSYRQSARYARTETGHVVAYTGFTAARVAQRNNLCYVVPRLSHGARRRRCDGGRRCRGVGARLWMSWMLLYTKYNGQCRTRQLGLACDAGSSRWHETRAGRLDGRQAGRRCFR